MTSLGELGCCCGTGDLKNPLLAQLCSEHDLLLGLAERLRTTLASNSGGVARVAAITTAGVLRTLLMSHHKLEEARFLPWIAKLDWPLDAQELVVEHRQGEDLLDSIVVALRQGNLTRALASTQALQSALMGHVAHEGRIFKKLDQEAYP